MCHHAQWLRDSLLSRSATPILPASSPIELHVYHSASFRDNLVAVRLSLMLFPVCVCERKRCVCEREREREGGGGNMNAGVHVRVRGHPWMLHLSFLPPCLRWGLLPKVPGVLLSLPHFPICVIQWDYRCVLPSLALHGCWGFEPSPHGLHS